MRTTEKLNQQNTYYLETKRLVLRPFVAADSQRLVEIFADNRVGKWVDDGLPLSEDRAKKWIAASFESVQKNGTSAGAIIEKSTLNMIGWGGIVHPIGTEPEIIYGFEFDAWGKGYGTELASAIIQNGLSVQKYKTIRATIDPENVASSKILKSQGFKLVSSGLDEHGLPTDTYNLDNGV